jgi:tetratricopeptide (TPR) repeat protein
MFEMLAANDPTNADRQHGVAASHTKIGDALSAQGDHAGGHAAYAAALAVYQALAAKDPTNADRQADLAGCHEKLGDELAAQGNKPDALAAYTAGLVIAQGLVAKHANHAAARELVTTLSTKSQRR